MDTGFDLYDPDDRGDGVGDMDALPSRAEHKAAADRAVVTVTLCACLIIATVGIIGLMAMGRNVAKEVSIAVAAQWALLLRAHYKG